MLTLSQSGVNYKGLNNPPQVLFNSVMNADNSAAGTLAEQCGAKLVPGTSYTTVDEVAKFYGVRETYLTSLLYRSGISNIQTPGDYMRISPNSFMRNFDVRKTEAKVNPEDERLLDVSQDGFSISIQRQGVLHLLSARTVLAVAVLLSQSRYGGKSKNTTKVMRYLVDSDFNN